MTNSDAQDLIRLAKLSAIGNGLGNMPNIVVDLRHAAQRMHDAYSRGAGTTDCYEIVAAIRDRLDRELAMRPPVAKRWTPEALAAQACHDFNDES